MTVSENEGICCETKTPSSSFRRSNPQYSVAAALPPMASQRSDGLRVPRELEQAYRQAGSMDGFKR